MTNRTPNFGRIAIVVFSFWMLVLAAEARSETIRVLSQAEVAAVCSKYRHARTTNLKLLEAVHGSFVAVVVSMFPGSEHDKRLDGRVVPRTGREHLLYVTGDLEGLRGVADKVRGETPIVIFGIIDEYMPDMENSCRITMKVLAAR